MNDEFLFRRQYGCVTLCKISSTRQEGFNLYTSTVYYLIKYQHQKKTILHFVSA
jgi:hypothetical protein